MPKESFNYIQSHFNHFLSPIKFLSATDNERKDKKDGFLNLEIEMIDFDALTKEVGSTFCSPDALALNGDMLHFIEFKNQAWKKVDKPNLLNKILQGVSVFGWHTKNITKLNHINIIYTVICNPDKNISVKKTSEESYVFNVIQKNLELSGNSPITDREVNEHKKRQENRLEKISDLLTGLSKFGIIVKVDTLLIQEEIDEFLSQFQNPALT